MIQKETIKGVILDFDGVVIDSTNISIQGQLDFAKQKGYPCVSYEQLRQLWGLPWTNVISAIYSKSDAERFMEEYYPWKLKQGIQYPPFPETLRSLTRLRKAGLLLSLLTSRDKRTLFLHMTNASVPTEIFFFIQAPNGHQDSRPKTFRPTFKQFKRAGLKKENLIYVGDTIFDAQAARAAQIEFIGVLTGATTKEEFLRIGAKYIINSIAELPSLIGL